MNKFKKVLCLIFLCGALLLSTTSVFAAEDYEFVINYSVAEDTETSSVTVEFIVNNNTSDNKRLILVAAMFDETDSMLDVSTEDVHLGANSVITANLSINISGRFNKEYIKCFAVEDYSSMRLLGETKLIHNLNPDIAEYYTYISAATNETVNVVLKTSTTDSNRKYTICYNPEKIQPVDLCALTHEKELLTGEIQGTSITIEKIDTELGKIVFSVSGENGWTGYNNIVKFKALKDLDREKIIAFEEGENNEI